MIQHLVQLVIEADPEISGEAAAREGRGRRRKREIREKGSPIKVERRWLMKEKNECEEQRGKIIEKDKPIFAAREGMDAFRIERSTSSICHHRMNTTPNFH